MTFPLRMPDVPEFDGDLPEAVDVAIIGGGIVGVCTALFAARAGLRVVVLEKGRVAAEQSSRNWGWIRVQGRAPAEIPVAQTAQRLWQDLDAECGGRLGVRQIGVTYLARSETQMARYTDWLGSARPFDVSSRMLSASETRDLMGGAGQGWLGALHTPTDFKAEPWVAVPELARLAVSEGATIREACAVRALDLQGGKVAGVVTERGRIRAEQIVLAGGAWSSLFLRRHGVDIPQLSVRSTAMATGRVPQVMGTAAYDTTLSMAPRLDGGFTLAPSRFSELFIGPDALRHIRHYLPLLFDGRFDGRLRGPAPEGFPDAVTTPRKWSEDAVSPFERMRILDPAPSGPKVSEVSRRFAQAYPQVGQVALAARWAGMIDVLPDELPIIDRAPAVEGLIVATGMSGHGFGTGPAYGQVLADLLGGHSPNVDLSAFALLRFGASKPRSRATKA